MCSGDAHPYYSTACYHANMRSERELHDKCRLTCKWCPARCICACHGRAATDENFATPDPGSHQ